MLILKVDFTNCTYCKNVNIYKNINLAIYSFSKRIEVKIILKIKKCCTYPANIAPKFAINHSGLLNPNIHTERRGSNPNFRNALAQVRTSLKYSL